MDDNMVMTIVYFMLFGWISILSIAKAISMIINAWRNKS